MNPVNHTVNNSKGYENNLELVAYAVNHTEPLEKIAKITERIIRIADVIYGSVSYAVSNLSSQLRDTIIVFETIRFIGIMNVLICPKNGKYFLTDVANSWQKRAASVTLAVHCAFKSVKGLNRFGFMELGVMAKNAIGKLPIFVLVMDSFTIASSFFSSWDSFAKALPNAQKKLAQADLKIEKWEYRQSSIEFLRNNDEFERISYETKYNAKAIELYTLLNDLEMQSRLNEDKLQKALESQKLEEEAHLPKVTQETIIRKCGLESKILGLKIERIQGKIQKNDSRIAKIAGHNFKELVEDLEKTHVDLKIKKWEVYQANAKQEESKVWLRIANAIGKIAVVTFALVLTAINVWTAPFLLSLLVLGVLVDSIGLSKILVEEFCKPQPIPKNLIEVNAVNVVAVAA